MQERAFISMPMLIEQKYRGSKRKNQKGYISFLVFGPEGSGKTSYALWVGYFVYRNWDIALRYLYFYPEQAIVDLMRAHDAGLRLKYIIFDDAGMWLSKRRWYEEPVKRFLELYNVIRSLVACVAFTSPSDELVKELREKAWLRIVVEELTKDVVKRLGIPVEVLGLDPERLGKDEFYSIARIYRLQILPTFERRVFRYNYEIYPTFYPDNVYEKYEEKRREAVGRALKQYASTLNGGLRESLLELKKLIGNEFLEVLTVYYLVNIANIPKTRVAKIMGVDRSTVYRWLYRIEKYEKDLEEIIAEVKLPNTIKARS